MCVGCGRAFQSGRVSGFSAIADHPAPASADPTPRASAGAARCGMSLEGLGAVRRLAAPGAPAERLPVSGPGERARSRPFLEVRAARVTESRRTECAWQGWRVVAAPHGVAQFSLFAGFSVPVGGAHGWKGRPLAPPSGSLRGLVRSRFRASGKRFPSRCLSCWCGMGLVQSAPGLDPPHEGRTRQSALEF
jgi:hypothetical protein